MAVLVPTMACKVSDDWLLIESNSLAGARAAVVCEQLTAELCAFAVSSASRRCVLENTHRAGRPTVYQCRTSEVVVEDARLAGLVETDRHRRHLLRLPPRPARRRRRLLTGVPPGVPQHRRPILQPRRRRG